MSGQYKDCVRTDKKTKEFPKKLNFLSGQNWKCPDKFRTSKGFVRTIANRPDKTQFLVILSRHFVPNNFEHNGICPDIVRNWGICSQLFALSGQKQKNTVFVRTNVRNCSCSFMFSPECSKLFMFVFMFVHNCPGIFSIHLS